MQTHVAPTFTRPIANASGKCTRNLSNNVENDELKVTESSKTVAKYFENEHDLPNLPTEESRRNIQQKLWLVVSCLLLILDLFFHSHLLITD